MSMQGMGSAPMRNQQMNPKIPVPAGGKSDPSTVASGASQSGHAAGSAVQGFSGSGMKPAKI